MKGDVPMNGGIAMGDEFSEKPTPIPRNRVLNRTQSPVDTRNNNEEEVQGSKGTKSKPIPLPRKFLQKFSTGSLSPDKKKGKDTSPPQENKEEPLSDEAKRGTINIFKRGRVIDPFEEFEKDLRDAHLLRAVSFTSPLHELSAEAQARLSSTSSLNQSNSDSSEYYDQPAPLTTPAQQPMNIVPKKPQRAHRPNSKVGVGNLDNQTYEPLSTFSVQPTSPPTYSVVVKPKRTTLTGNPIENGLRNNKNQTHSSFASSSSSSSVPSMEGSDFPMGEMTNSSDGYIDVTYARVKDELRRGGLSESSSRTTSLPSIDESTFNRNVSNRSSEGSNSSRPHHSKNDYDDVAIEDGTLVFLDNQLNTRSKRKETRGEASSVTTSRNSIVMEFDPLFETRGIGRSGKMDEKRTYHGDTREPDLVTSSSLSDDHRYEFIDAEAEDGDLRVVSGNFASGRENPTYFPLLLSREPYTGVGDYRDLNPKPALSPVEENYEEVEPPPPLTEVKPTNDSEESRSECGEHEESEVDPGISVSSVGPVGQLKRSEGSGSFLRRLSHKIRLIPIREESNGRSTSVENLGNSERCRLCLLDHSEGGKCKFIPVARQNIVYSSYLYRPTGIVQKEYTKRWAVLAKGKLTFYNDKSVVLEEIALEKSVLIGKKSETRQGSNGQELRPFHIQFLGGKSSSLPLATTTDHERCSWMQKWVEAFVSAFPTHVLSSFDRGGWCFIKESVTSDWYPSWLILKGRNLFYAFASGEEFYEMDLRKARSVSLSTKEADYKCPCVDNSEVLTVDMICKILFIQTENPKVTSGWEKVIISAARQNGDQFHEMQLTLDDVPVIVDKCIDFLYAHGTLAEGIYRQSGSNTRITQLLADFQKDSWSVQISHKDFSAHDVAGTLKRFFRTLPEPLFTTKLYDDWIRTSRIVSQVAKMTTYENLLDSLPPINYNILKKLICHLYAVHELHEKNLMPLNNLAPIWGPTLMNVESGLKVSQSQSESDEQYRSACSESEVVKDLIENYYVLFRVDSISREKEKKMQDALENFHLGSTKRKCSGDMKLWIYIWEKDETTAINITLTPTGTAHTIVQQLCRMAQLRSYDNLSLHEVICQKSLERPLHPSEIVIETVLRWSIWDIDERKDNYLILKKNTLYPALIPYAKDPTAVYGDFKFADSKTKSFRKYAFKFGRAMLKYYKDSKAATELGCWKIEDIVWYMGSEPKRTPAPRWAFTFVKRNYPFKRSREEPYFGNVVSCTSEEELHKWIAAMVVGEHSAGLYPSVIV